MVTEEMIGFSLFIALLIFALILMFFYIAIRKWIGNRREEHHQMLLERYSPVVQRYIIAGERSRSLLPDRRPEKIRALESLFVRYARILNGEAEAERIQRYVEQHLADQYRSELSCRNWKRRMLTLYRVEAFHLRSFEEIIVRNMESRRKLRVEEQLRMMRILALFGSEHIKKFISLSPEVSEFQRRDILCLLPSDRFTRLIEQGEEYSEPFRLNMIDAVGIRGIQECLPFLERHLEHSNPEFRIRALKAMCRLGLIPARTEYGKYSTSPRWQERMMAARLYGVVRDPMYVPLLHTMLHDAERRVRTEAQISLGFYPDTYLDSHAYGSIAEAAAASDPLNPGECSERRSMQ